METTIPIISCCMRFRFKYLHRQTLKYETTRVHYKWTNTFSNWHFQPLFSTTMSSTGRQTAKRIKTTARNSFDCQKSVDLLSHRMTGGQPHRVSAINPLLYQLPPRYRPGVALCCGRGVAPSPKPPASQISHVSRT